MELEETSLHFGWKKPLFGRTKGGLTLEDDLHIEHQLLRSRVVVPLAQVAAVVHVRAADPGPPVVRRELRHLDLTPEAGGGDRVAIVLHEPVRLGPFKLGSHHALAITGRERRGGVDVDVIDAAVGDPAGLVTASSRRGVRTPQTLAEAIRSVSEEVTEPELAERRRERASKLRRSRALLASLGLVMTGALAVQISLRADAPASTVARVAVAAGAWAVLLAGPMSLALARHRSRAGLDDRSSHAPVRLALALLAPLVAAGFYVAASVGTQALIGPSYVVACGIAAALPAGLLFGLLLRPDIESPPGGPAANLYTAERRGGLVPIAAMTLAAAAVLAWVAQGEPGSVGDLSIARDAVLRLDDLPSGWTNIFDPTVDRGSKLHGRACGITDDLPTHTAGYTREYTTPLPDGSEGARLVATVLVAATEEVAARVHRAAYSSSYQACVVPNQRRTALRGFDPEVTGATTFERVVLPEMGVPAVLDRFTTRLSVPSGRIGEVHTALIRLQIGRLTVRTVVISYVGRPSDEEVVVLARSATREAGAALR